MAENFSRIFEMSLSRKTLTVFVTADQIQFDFGKLDSLPILKDLPHETHSDVVECDLVT